MWNVIRENPRAVLYAVLMHLVLLVVLIFSLDWTPKITRPAGQKIPIEAKLIDQRQLDAIAERKQAEQRKIEEAKRQQALQEKRKLEAEQKRKQDAERKRKAESEAKRKAEVKRKADLAAKQKAESERKRQAEAEQKRKTEQAAKQKAAAERKRKAEAEASAKAEAEMQQRLAAEQAARDDARVQSVLGEYAGYIADKVERNWLQPSGSATGLKCLVNVKLIPGGEVVSVKVVKSSGDSLFDRSAETAVLKASPLPVPTDPAIAKHFRDFNFNFDPYR